MRSPGLAESERRYREEKSTSGATSHFSGAEAVVRDAIEDLLADSKSDVELLTFVAEVEADPRISGLLAAMAALIAIEAELWNVAADLAERIISGDQHDLFAQRLLIASEEKARNLNLEVDAWLADRFCGNPFEEIEIRADGKVNTCCSAWMPASIGSIHEHHAAQYWNSIKAAEIRSSVLDGDFSYCSRLYCPKIVQRSLPRKSDVTAPLQRECIDNDLIVVDHKPRRIVLSEDRSCNLSCPSCRTELIQLRHGAAAKLDGIFDSKIAPLLDDANQIKITGSGDPFGSRHFRHVLQSLTDVPVPSRRIQIQTNGVLMDEKAWTDLRLDGHVSTVWVSVDAARQDTYEVVRRGGSFDRLCRNLDFLGGLRAERRIDLLRLDFVVQALNFREMPEFVEWARSIGADGVHFLMLRNWGTFTPEDYRRHNIGSPNHPEHPAFQAILKDPRLSSPFVDLGNVYEAS